MLCPLPKPSSTTSPRKPSQARARRVLRPPSSPAAATSRGVTWVDQKFIRRTYASGGRAEADGVALSGLLALDLTVLERCGGGEVLEQVRCRVRHPVLGGVGGGGGPGAGAWPGAPPPRPPRRTRPGWPGWASCSR